MLKVKDITGYLESLAPLSSQESYDNAGLITGNPEAEVNGILLALDCTEEILEDALNKGCNMIIAHHPIVFSGLKKLIGSNYVERTLIKAIKNDLTIYAIHTNLDNYRLGVNHEIGKRLGLQNLRVLAPKSGVLSKLVCYVPKDHAENVLSAMFKVGAGNIGDYAECSYQMNGTGTFMPLDGSNPFEGKTGERSEVSEIKVEVLVSKHLMNKAVVAMKNAHPYEEVAYDVIPLENVNQFEGSGMIGELQEPIEEESFLKMLKEAFHCGAIRHTAKLGKKISKVAFCGGSGSFLLNNAKRSGADVFITGDFKYHDFFDADGQIMIADIGHYESEQFTSNLLADLLTKKFPKFAVHLTEVNTNPINYY